MSDEMREVRARHPELMRRLREMIARYEERIEARRRSEGDAPS